MFLINFFLTLFFSIFKCIDVPLKHKSESGDDAAGETTKRGIEGLLHQQASNDDPSASKTSHTRYTLTVRSGSHKRLPGFQPDIVCLNPWIDNTTPPYKITSIAINSSSSL